MTLDATQIAEWRGRFRRAAFWRDREPFGPAMCRHWKTAGSRRPDANSAFNRRPKQTNDHGPNGAVVGKIVRPILERPAMV
jgi:hypothetical protein